MKHIKAMRIFLSILFLLCTVSVQAWDFCAPNQDGIMLYYNRIPDDEAACEVAPSREADYCYPVIRVPAEVVIQADQERGGPDTTLTVIGLAHSAFARGMMKKIELPSTIGYIGNGAFANCQWLESIEWPDGNEWLYSIGEVAFYNCGQLLHFQIPKTVEEIAERAFYRSGLQSVDFEEGNPYITSIPRECFRESGIVNLTLPSTIREIGEYAFADCAALNPPRLPVGLKIIGSYAFHNHHQWSQLELPETVTDIGEYAFCSPKSDGRYLCVNTLYVNAKTPPYCLSTKTLGDDTYDNSKRMFTSEITDLVFVVPEKTSVFYQTTSPWNRIAIPCYRTRDTSGIPSVTATQQEDAEESIFSLDGRRLDFRQRGINIVRHKDGSASKVLKR